MPDYLFIFKDPSSINSAELQKALKDGDYDIDKEEVQLNKLRQLILMGDNQRAKKLCDGMGLVAV